MYAMRPSRFSSLRASLEKMEGFCFQCDVGIRGQKLGRARADIESPGTIAYESTLSTTATVKTYWLRSAKDDRS